MEMRGEEKRLWEIVKPYIINCELRENAPPEVKKAAERLGEISWDLSRGQ